MSSLRNNSAGLLESWSNERSLIVVLEMRRLRLRLGGANAEGLIGESFTPEAKYS